MPHRAQPTARSPRRQGEQAVGLVGAMISAALLAGIEGETSANLAVAYFIRGYDPGFGAGPLAGAVQICCPSCSTWLRYG
jgi:hypothetical protein